MARKNSREFDRNDRDTWLKAGPETCPHGGKDPKEAPPFDDVHYFGWPEDVDDKVRDQMGMLNAVRSVWNPLAPICKRCGRSLGDIITKDLPGLRKLVEELRKKVAP